MYALHGRRPDQPLALERGVARLAAQIRADEIGPSWKGAAERVFVGTNSVIVFASCKAKLSPTLFTIVA
jgi:hypothetical protein